MSQTAQPLVLRDMIGFATERLMEMEVGAKTGASFGERSVDRPAQRNGYRERLGDARGLIISHAGKSS